MLSVISTVPTLTRPHGGRTRPWCLSGPPTNVYDPRPHPRFGGEAEPGAPVFGYAAVSTGTGSRRAVGPPVLAAPRSPPPAALFSAAAFTR
ncbi:hypothetical protein GCM10027160_16560 [Streptomyces calidiresistens]